jgi:hypothetical protein
MSGKLRDNGFGKHHFCSYWHSPDTLPDESGRFSVLRGDLHHLSPMGLPKPFYVLRGVVVAMEARSTVRAGGNRSSLEDERCWTVRHDSLLGRGGAARALVERRSSRLTPGDLQTCAPSSKQYDGYPNGYFSVCSLLSEYTKCRRAGGRSRRSVGRLSRQLLRGEGAAVLRQALL